MELSKHTSHRNLKYLNWLRKRNCVISGEKAQCTHHIRLGTNGGCSLKPSDYFCIPLLNKYHTTGPDALHIIGEKTFLQKFDINCLELFINYLKEFLAQNFEIYYMLEDKLPEDTITDLINIIESKNSKKDPSLKTPKRSVTEDSFYQIAKKLKNERDKNLRKKLKENTDQYKPKKKSLKGDKFYEKAKEFKRARDKELRRKRKEELSTSAKSI